MYKDSARKENISDILDGEKPGGTGRDNRVGTVVGALGERPEAN